MASGLPCVYSLQLTSILGTSWGEWCCLCWWGAEQGRRSGVRSRGVEVGSGVGAWSRASPRAELSTHQIQQAHRGAPGPCTVHLRAVTQAGHLGAVKTCTSMSSKERYSDRPRVMVGRAAADAWALPLKYMLAECGRTVWFSTWALGPPCRENDSWWWRPPISLPLTSTLQFYSFTFLRRTRSYGVSQPPLLVS